MKQRIDGKFAIRLRGIPHLAWVDQRLTSKSGKVTRTRGFLVGPCLVGWASVRPERAADERARRNAELQAMADRGEIHRPRLGCTLGCNPLENDCWWPRCGKFLENGD